MWNVKCMTVFFCVSGKELRVECEVYDWFLAQSATGSAISVVYSNDVQIKILGDKVRVFKPNQKVDIYVCTVLIVHR